MNSGYASQLENRIHEAIGKIDELVLYRGLAYDSNVPTKRQLDVAKHVFIGENNRQIADELGISESTIDKMLFDYRLSKGLAVKISHNEYSSGAQVAGWIGERIDIPDEFLKNNLELLIIYCGLFRGIDLGIAKGCYEGKTYTEIGNILDLKTGTVSNHVTGINTEVFHCKSPKMRIAGWYGVRKAIFRRLVETGLITDSMEMMGKEVVDEIFHELISEYFSNNLPQPKI